MTDVDVLVAGAGAAGLAAAITAADRGLSVVVAEASATWRDGSNTAMSTSMIPAAGSRWQREAGIDDSPDLFRDDVMRKTGGLADATVARALVDVAPALVAWLADACGVALELVTDLRYPGHARLRCHAVCDRSGRTLLTGLLAALAQREAELVVPLRLVDVAEAGGALLARTARPSGDEETIRARAVVLATNGFGANRELVRTHLPEIADGLYFGGEGSRGDALAIGERLGADTGFLDAYQGHGSVAVPHGILLPWAAVVHGGVLVNARGERFGDETAGYSEFGRPVLEQPGHEAWVVYDRRVDELCRPFADYRRCLDAGAVRWAADAHALAEITGAPASALAATLSDAHAAAAGDAPDAHGRTDWEAALEPPFAAVRVTGALFHTQGGLLVDGGAAVLRGGRPVPGLYAAGGAAAGISGHGAGGYLAGNGLLAALGLGYLAGNAACRS
jgi:fumarate reductase flavoprotein subunit